MGNRRAPRLAECIEEPPQSRSVTTLRRPHQPARIRDRRPPSNTCGPSCRRSRRSRFGANHRNDRRSHRFAPRPGRGWNRPCASDLRQLAHRRLRTARRQPGHRLIEGPGVPGAVPRPGHGRDDDPMLTTRHPRVPQPPTDQSVEPDFIGILLVVGEWYPRPSHVPPRSLPGNSAGAPCTHQFLDTLTVQTTKIKPTPTTTTTSAGSTTAQHLVVFVPRDDQHPGLRVPTP